MSEEVTAKVLHYLAAEGETKNERIKELQEEIERLEYVRSEEKRTREYEERWRWRHIRTLKESGKYAADKDVIDANWDLPVPRLEIRYRRLDRYNRIADYGLVTQHLGGHISFCPLGSTKVCGGAQGLTDCPADSFPGWLPRDSRCRAAWSASVCNQREQAIVLAGG